VGQQTGLLGGMPMVVVRIGAVLARNFWVLGKRHGISERLAHFAHSVMMEKL
jgi:hypothetical protein